MTTLKIVNPADRLEALVSKHRNQTRASLALQVSESYFSDLLRGRRACSDRILKKLKLRRVIVDAPDRMQTVWSRLTRAHIAHRMLEQDAGREGES